MKFRTEVVIGNSDRKINPDDALFSIGSCFAKELTDLLEIGQMQTYNNPFGTLFNPYSINVALTRIYQANLYKEEELILFNNGFISLDHHSSFTSSFAHKTLENINQKIEDANLFLQKTQWVIITYGTSFIHQFIPKNKLVANCHKIPNKFFNKQLLSTELIEQSIQESIVLLEDICKENVQILFSISPVRHTKEGMQENLRSKSQLISSLHNVIEGKKNCHYLPIYEIMMDDLRDYRFYKEDLIHPNSQAINYIFEKFGNAYFSDETMDFIEENFKINQALKHKTTDKDHPNYTAFLEKTKQRMALQQQKVKHKIFNNALEIN